MEGAAEAFLEGFAAISPAIGPKRPASLSRWVIFMGQKAGALIALFLLASPAAAESINRTSLAGEAIEGFDPVVYFTAGVPRQGTRAFLYEWNGAVWRFVSKADLDLFKARPERYAPAYGGYCAFAMAKGIEADIHPFAFAVLDGRLYLFTTFESRDRFLANSEFRRAAEENWNILSKKQF